MSHYVIHYAEIGLKGGNRPHFERRLASNIKRSLGVSGLSIRRLRGRLLTDPPAMDGAEVEKRLQRVPGIAYFSPVTVVPLDLEAIRAEAVRISTGVEARSFRIETKRANKQFPLNSMEVNRDIGASVAVASGMAVKLVKPEHTVWIELTGREALVSCRRIRGLGGLPTGASGTTVQLLSGGIDSPVAAYKMIRRGSRVVLLHFHNYTRYSDKVRAKILDIAKVLAKYQLRSRLYLVPFEELQSSLLAAVAPPQRMVAYRRVMLQVGELILTRERALAFVTGDSLGQVASQTLENLRAIYQSSKSPILCPLIGDDKEEIIDLARKIGTYDISIRPYDDCCSFMIAPHPDTKVRADLLAKREARIPLPELARAAVEAAEVYDIDGYGSTTKVDSPMRPNQDSNVDRQVDTSTND